MGASKAEKRMMVLAWDELKAQAAEMKKTDPSFTPAKYILRMNKKHVRSINAQGSEEAKQFPRIEIDFEDGVHDFVCVHIPQNQLKALRERGPFKGDDQVVYEVKRDTGLALKRACTATAKRGHDTDEFQARTAQRCHTCTRNWRDAGNSAILDGSKGGTGRQDHGGLKKATKECPVVAGIQKCLAPKGSSPEDTLDGQVRRGCYLLEVIKERGELPANIEQLYERAGRGNTQHVDNAVRLMGRTLEPGSFTTLDIEGFVTHGCATGGVTEVGVSTGSLGDAAQPQVVLDERGKRRAGRRAPLTDEELEKIASVLAKRGAIHHHSGKEKIFVRGLLEAFDQPMPEMVDVFPCICLGFGRAGNGQRRAGFEGADAVSFGMDALAFTFKLGPHIHIGVEDACKQHVAWRPLLIALRMHYYGY